MKNTHKIAMQKRKPLQASPVLESSRTGFSTITSHVSTKRFKRTSNSKELYKLSRSNSKESLFNESSGKARLMYIKCTKNELSGQQRLVNPEIGLHQSHLKKQSSVNNPKTHLILKKYQDLLKSNSRVTTEPNEYKNSSTNLSNKFQVNSSIVQKQKHKESIIDKKFDQQIQIIDLQKQLLTERRNKEKQQKKIKVLEDQLLRTKKQVAIYLEENDMLKKVIIEYSKNFEKSQKNVQMSQKSLSEANGNLEKLKNAIKFIRHQQLSDLNKKYQKQIDSLKAENGILRTKLTEMQQTITNLKSQIKTLETSKLSSMGQMHALKQIESFRGQLQKSKTFLQETLQEKVTKLEEQLQKNKQETKSLMVKISCMNKKSSDEISQIKKTKELQLIDLKKKMAKMNQQLKQKNTILKKSANINMNPENKQLYRSCIMKSNNTRNNGQNFDLDLSSESGSES